MSEKQNKMNDVIWKLDYTDLCDDNIAERIESPNNNDIQYLKDLLRKGYYVNNILYIVKLSKDYIYILKCSLLLHKCGNTSDVCISLK